MKKIYLYISLLLFSLLASCESNITTESHFMNDTSIITGKVRGNQGTLILVVKRLKDTTDVGFIKQYNLKTNVPFERLFVFAHLGDTLVFDYIGKYRFFKK